MAGARTKVSNWIYRLSLTLLVLGTVKHGQFMYDQFSISVGETETAVYWTALFGTMSGSFSLAVAAMAMVFRSGAVVWLLGLQFGLLCFLLGPSLLIANSTGPAIITAVVAILVLGVAGALFTYLFRKEEIRSL